MTTLPQGRGLAPSQLKTSSTTQSSHVEVARNHEEQRLASRSQSRTRPPRSRQEASVAESLSEASTLSLIRRILVSDKSQAKSSRSTPQPIQDLLPPLTSSNEIDFQLYAIVAIILKDFVNVWYSRITPDHIFNEEVIQIIAHCTRALEQRLRHLDLIEVLLNDLAALLDQHVKAYRYARTQSEQYSYASNLRSIYHSINPHPALDPIPEAMNPTSHFEQRENETIYRQLLVQGAMAMLLPTEDFQNDSLRTLVSDVVADLILGQVLAGKLCEGWFLHDMIIKSMRSTQSSLEAITTGKEVETQTKTRLEKFGLISKKEKQSGPPSPSRRSTITAWFWRILQILYSLFLCARFTLHGLSQARTSQRKSQDYSEQDIAPKHAEVTSGNTDLDPDHRPVLSFRIYDTMATVVRLQDRMPWLMSTMMFFQHSLLSGMGQLASYDTILDRFLHNSLTSILLPPTIWSQILIAFRTAVFPHNSLGPPAPPPPSHEERAVIRREAAQTIVSLLPPIVARTYFNTSDQDDIVEQVAMDILDCFGDEYLNKHLVYGILDLFLVKIIPELAESGVTDLLAERGVNWGTAGNDSIIDDSTKVPTKI